MANTYESKFKGVEIDDGVNIATYATGTGGINVTIKGTTNVTGTGGRHLEIDGSGVKITPVSGTGTSTTDVMSQKAVTDELGKKQDTITATTKIKAGSLDLTGNAFIGGQLSCNDTSGSRLLLSIGYPEGAYYVFGPQTVPYHTGPGTYFPSNGGILATIDDVNNEINNINNTSLATQSIQMKLLDSKVEFYNRTKQAPIIHVFKGSISSPGFSVYSISTPAFNSTISLTLPQKSGNVIVRTGEITAGNLIAGNGTDTVKDSGIKATDVMTTGNVKTINGESIIGSGDITIGGGSAGVSSIGGKTGAITLSTGLAMSGQQLVNKVKVYTSGNYLCIDTN